jgi:hypothetical protein
LADPEVYRVPDPPTFLIFAKISTEKNVRFGRKRLGFRSVDGVLAPLVERLVRNDYQALTGFSDSPTLT